MSCPKAKCFGNGISLAYIYTQATTNARLQQRCYLIIAHILKSNARRNFGRSNHLIHADSKGREPGHAAGCNPRWHPHVHPSRSRSNPAHKGKGKGKGKAAGAPRQGDSEAARRVDALESGDYGGAGLGEEEEDLAERFTRCLLEDASGGY